MKFSSIALTAALVTLSAAPAFADPWYVVNVNDNVCMTTQDAAEAFNMPVFNSPFQLSGQLKDSGVNVDMKSYPGPDGSPAVVLLSTPNLSSVTMVFTSTLQECSAMLVAAKGSN
jgi:hypothetical protein